MIQRKLIWAFVLCVTILGLIIFTSHRSPKPKVYKTIIRTGVHKNTHNYFPSDKEPAIVKELTPGLKQRGEYWVYYNFIPASKTFGYNESITYTTHGDFTFLDNLVPLAERWKGPISIALHTPGDDFESTLYSILFLRNCIDSSIIQDYVSFHLYFGKQHIPNSTVLSQLDVSGIPFDCEDPVPFEYIPSNGTYKSKNDLMYPINVGRNIAREMAQTHFILPSDIELYPSLNIIPDFLRMIKENTDSFLQLPGPRIFPLHLFEVEANAQVPGDKRALQEMLRNKTAIPFHKKVCSECHSIPMADEWQKQTHTNGLHVFNIGKRVDKHKTWEPIFIGTNEDPWYDERLSWEGKSDKMTQGYIFCVKDYNFMILDNAFLVHRPGIKHYVHDKKRNGIAGKQSNLISKVITPELLQLFGEKPGCVVR